MRIGLYKVCLYVVITRRVSWNIKAGIYETTEFLEKFLRNLLLDEKNELHNRDMHISGQFLLGHDGSMNDLINDPIKLNEREKKIVEILRREPALTRSGMARPWNGHLYNHPRCGISEGCATVEGCSAIYDQCRQGVSGGR